ncbi:MAG: hypothetical protein JRJ58_17750, partial [Deltaproteobacteria bacterium]|nr:hypothetical protein [Deltaproteobacteria bacterium]
MTLGIALAPACTPPEERADAAREAVARAVERGDRTAALDAIEDVHASLPDTPDALLEVSRLRIRAGDAPLAAWLLESGMRRYPDRDDVRLALANVA